MCSWVSTWAIDHWFLTFLLAALLIYGAIETVRCFTRILMVLIARALLMVLIARARDVGAAYG